MDWSHVVERMQTFAENKENDLPKAVFGVELGLGADNLRMASVAQDSETPWTFRTIFSTGSMSKTVVAAAVLKVIEEHPADFGTADPHVALNRPVHTLRGMADLGAPDERNNPNPGWQQKREITLLHLLTHTASLRWIEHFDRARVVPAGSPDPATQRASDWVGSPGLTNESIHTPAGWIPGRKATLQQVSRHAMRQRLIEEGAGFRPPGTRASYSNFDHVIAAHVVEELSGTPFSQYVKQKIFDPLKMSDSFFLLSERTDSAAERIADSIVIARHTAEIAPPLAADGPGRDPQWDEQRRGWTYPWPEGGLYSTLGDLLKLLRMVRENGKPVLTEESARLMQQNQFLNGPLVKTLWTDESRTRGAVRKLTGLASQLLA